MWGGDSFRNGALQFQFQSKSAPRPSNASMCVSPYSMHQQDSGGICKISNLNPGIIKEKIIGVTIAKEEPRHFPSKKDPSNERHVMNFTIRDSPQDFINATCWGNKDFIQELGLQFHIGDVVEIVNAGVQPKPLDGSDEKFHPYTPSPFSLNVSENRSTVSLYTGWDINEFMGFSHIPVKASNDFYTIADIFTNGSKLNDESISILAVIRSIGAIKEVNSRNNKQLKRCEVKLLDDTALTFTMVLWDSEQIALVQNLTPKDTVLFAQDVRVKFDDYKKTMVATATSKSILTVNPDIREAHAIYQYAQRLDIPIEEPTQQLVSRDYNDNTDLSSIKTIYTISQCKDKQASKPGSGGVEYAIIFATVTLMDIDADQGSVVYRCAKCNQRLDWGTLCCVNQDCPQGSRFDLDWDSTEKTASFEIRVSLSDHTGTLESCYVNNDVCQTWLQTTVEEYINMSEEQKTQLKWQYLLEQCKVYVKICLASFDRLKPSLRILRIEAANPGEATRNL